jgi:signal transduction histidine kinase/ligand-binding sensor domain-containing protein/ActR/RegA family two-component response regulator
MAIDAKANSVWAVAWTVLFWVWTMGLRAQSPLHLPPSAPYVAQHWDVSNGLPQNSVGDILQTSDGFVWVGTFAGLCRFDGHSWRVFDTSVAPGLGNNRVLALASTAKGTLWIGTEHHGLSCANNATFAGLDNWPGRSVGAICSLRDGRVLAASESDVFEVQPSGRYLPLSVSPVAGVRCLVETDVGVYAVGVGGMVRLDGQAIEVVATHRLSDASLGPDGALYVAGTHGLEVLRGNRLEPVGAGPQESVQSVLAARDGSLWCATTHELIHLDPASTERSFHARIDWMVRCLAEDSVGGVFAGFLGGGLVRLQRAETRAVGANNGLPGGGQNSVLPDGNGSVYVATYAGLFHGRDGSYEQVACVGERPITAMCMEADGSLLVGLEGGLGRLRSGVFEGDVAKAPAGIVRALQRIGDEIWLGCGKGLFEVRGAHLEPLPLHPLLDRFVQRIVPGDAGEVWVASTNGCVRLSPDRQILGVWRSGVELPAGEIRAILPQPSGRTWIGIYGGGFVAIETRGNTVSRAVDRRDGLFDHSICSVAVLDDRWIVGSNRGTFVLDVRELDALVDGKVPSLSCRPLAGPADASVEPNGGLQSSACCTDGSAYLCGIDRLLVVSRESLAVRTAAPHVYIDRLLLGERSLGFAEVVETEPGQRTIVMQLGACELDHPEQVRFRWRLLPRDENWSAPSYSREAQFVLLEPGEYRFEAMATVADDLHSTGPVQVTLRVPPLPLERMSVRVGIGVVLCLAGWLAFRFGSSRMESRQRRLQRLVDERTMDLRNAQEGLERRVSERTSELEQALRQIEVDHEQRRGLERELELLRRMESVGQLAGGIAHDFNNLLTIVLGNASLLEMDLQGHPEEAELAMHIREAGERGRRMTRHLLAVASRETVQPSLVDLNEQVLGMSGMLEQLMGPRIGLSLRVADAPVHILAAPSQIEQILMNLAVNARDAMSKAGQFSVEVFVDGRRAGMRVRDNGRGMTPTVRERAFEPFFTTKERHRGTGLGLATVFGITKQMDGEIELDSVEGQGTTFCFYWPLAQGEANEVVVELQPGEFAAELSILLVEDEADVRRVLRQRLERAGCTVVEAECGEQAVERMRERKTVFDVVLSDVQMPGLVGTELIMALRAECPGLPMVFLTGHADVRNVVAGIRSLGIDVLGKPPSDVDLLHALLRASRASKGRSANHTAHASAVKMS